MGALCRFSAPGRRPDGDGLACSSAPQSAAIDAAGAHNRVPFTRIPKDRGRIRDDIDPTPKAWRRNAWTGIREYAGQSP